MDRNFSAAELAFRDEVKAFLESHLCSELRAGAQASTGVFAEPEIGSLWHQTLNDKGWLGYQWPKEYGGTGWTATQRYIFEKECAIAGAPSLPVLSLKLLAPVIWTFGTSEQKAKILPRILSGEDYWCQGFSEPGSGSDLASLRTSAKREGDHYIVNGSKIWTTHAHHANRIFCLVRTDSSRRPQDGISFLLIDLKQPGVTVRPIITLAGDHEVNEVFFDNAVAPASDLVGGEGKGWKIAKFLLENERGGSCYAPHLLSQLDAVERCAVEESDGHGGCLSDNVDWKRRVATIRLSAEALEIIELKILSDISKGMDPGPQTSLTKLLGSKIRQDIDFLAMDLFGPAGLQLEPPRPLDGENRPEPVYKPQALVAAAKYLNSRAWTIFGGTNEVQANIIAKTVLGL